MSRISNTAAYANINPVLSDYFVLTDLDNNLATKSCTLQSLQTLFGLSDTNIKVSVPAVNLHALTTTPYQLIAAPQTGYVLHIKSIVCFLDAGTTPFDFPATAVIPKMGTLEFNTIPQETLNSTGSAMHYLVGQDVLGGSYGIHLIQHDPLSESYKVWIIKNGEIVLWKEFKTTLPISLEYNINF